MRAVLLARAAVTATAAAASAAARPSTRRLPLRAILATGTLLLAAARGATAASSACPAAADVHCAAPPAFSTMALPPTFARTRVHAFGGPENIQLEKDVPMLKPGDGEVLVKIEAAGVNPVETYIRSGNYARKPELPFTLGNDGAGTIAAVGPNVPAGLAPGTRVFLSASLSGTYAQYALAAASAVHALPEALDFDAGAAVGIAYRTAHRALFQRARARPGHRVFVHGGSGGVGIAAIQLARAAGMHVIASAGTPAGLELCRQHGAAATLNHREPGYLSKLAELTDGHGVDVIIEMLSNINLGNDLEHLAVGGVVAVVGCRGPVEINPRLLMQRSASIVGVMGATPEEERETWAALEAGLATGVLRPVAGPAFALADAPAAHTEVLDHAHGGGSSGKVIIHPWA